MKDSTGTRWDSFLKSESWKTLTLPVRRNYENFICQSLTIETFWAIKKMTIGTIKTF